MLVFIPLPDLNRCLGDIEPCNYTIDHRKSKNPVESHVNFSLSKETSFACCNNCGALCNNAKHVCTVLVMQIIVALCTSAEHVRIVVVVVCRPVVSNYFRYHIYTSLCCIMSFLMLL